MKEGQTKTRLGRIETEVKTVSGKTGKKRTTTQRKMTKRVPSDSKGR